MSILLSILKMRCPKCHKGHLFENQNPYNLAQLSKMPEKCPCCGQRTEPEPAFYYGAMYMSYAISIMLSFSNYFFFEMLLGFSGVWFLSLNAAVLIVLWPVIFRYARVLYIYIFIKYDKDAARQTN